MNIFCLVWLLLMKIMNWSFIFVRWWNGGTFKDITGRRADIFHHGLWSMSIFYSCVNEKQILPLLQKLQFISLSLCFLLRIKDCISKIQSRWWESDQGKRVKRPDIPPTQVNESDQMIRKSGKENYRKVNSECRWIAGKKDKKRIIMMMRRGWNPLPLQLHSVGWINDLKTKKE